MPKSENISASRLGHRRKGKIMRKLAIVVALSSTVLATPALARNGAWYVGGDVGGMIVENTGFNFGLASTVPSKPNAQIAINWVVFFDWDRDEITPQAAAILDNVAAAYQQAGQASVLLAGHADRSGSEDYNIGISQRCANNVRAYLAGRGIPDGSMRTEAFGESRPLVETADGVREPQNRRVEITFE